VALKFFKKGSAGLQRPTDTAGWERSRECNIMKKIQRLTPRYDMGKHRFAQCFEDHAQAHAQGPQPYEFAFLVMEFGGEELYKVMHNPGMNIQNTCEVIKQMVQGLVYMATKDPEGEDVVVINPDIKPENFVIKRHPTETDKVLIKFIDFGGVVFVSNHWQRSPHKVGFMTTTLGYTPREYWDLLRSQAPRNQRFRSAAPINQAQPAYYSPWSSFNVFQVAVVIVELISGQSSILLQMRQENILRPDMNEKVGNTWTKMCPVKIKSSY